MSHIGYPNDRDIEIRYVLQSFTYVQQTALGVQGASALLVVIRDKDPRRGFCIHIEPDPSRNPGQEHAFWHMKHMPERLLCPGLQSRMTYQLSRSFWKLVNSGVPLIPEQVHDLFLGWLENLPRRCISCGTHQKAKLYRPTFCEDDDASRPCEATTASEPMIYLTEIQQDPYVVELLLTAISAAAQSNNASILPGSPISDQVRCLQALRKIPPIRNFQQRNSYDVMMSLEPDPQALLAWTCTTYRGFLISVPTGRFHIDSFPNAVQFLLADGGPRLERRFESQRKASGFGSRNKGPRKIAFFHGTSFARLYAILIQGLRSLSNDRSLCSNGAALGQGIYLTDSPSMALEYTRPLQASVSSHVRNMQFYRSRVLLCVELAKDIQRSDGPRSFGPGVFVVPDERAMVLRYIFLLPPETWGVSNEPVLRTEIESKLKLLRAEK